MCLLHGLKQIAVARREIVAAECVQKMNESERQNDGGACQDQKSRDDWHGR